MGKGDTERRARLLRGQWHSRGHSDQPDVLTAAEAWHRRADRYVFYSVSWWGDLPAGFQEFRFVAAHDMAFSVTMAGGDSHEQEAYLEADELVLAFERLPDEDAGDEQPHNDGDE